MTLDLMALAKQVDETYIDVECSLGVMRVYHVPDAVLLSGSTFYNEPEQPTVSMRTATGTQERLAKKGDPDFDEWQKEVNAIREKQFEIRQARGFVMALRDIDWSQYDVSQPPPAKLAQEIFNGHWPNEDVLRKKAWLDFTVLRVREDKEKILEAMNIMNQANEPSAEMVEEVKKNSE
jgi:hypothetical protein